MPKRCHLTDQVSIGEKQGIRESIHQLRLRVPGVTRNWDSDFCRFRKERQSFSVFEARPGESLEDDVPMGDSTRTEEWRRL